MDEDLVFEKLRRECLLANELLRESVGMMGVEAGREPGCFYRFLFNASIGLERLGKLVAICDFRIEHGSFPTDSYLRKIGHNLVRLFALAEDVRNRRKIRSKFGGEPTSAIHTALIEVLSEFSDGARYYNLDFLVSSKKIKQMPEKAWNEKVATPLLLEYPGERKREDYSEALQIGILLSRVMVFSGTSLSGDPISSPMDSILDEGRAEFVFERAKAHMIQIIRWFVEILMQLQSRESSFPYFGEILATFYNSDDFLSEFSDW